MLINSSIALPSLHRPITFRVRQTDRQAMPPSAALLLLLLLQLLGPSRGSEGGDASGGAGATQAMRGHMEPFGNQGDSSGIDQVDGFIPPKEFVNNYILKNRPLLFKGAAKKSPAFSKWTDEYLAAATPPRPAGDIFIEHNKKENRSQSYNYIHFKKFLEIYNTSNIYMVSDVPEYLLQDLVLPFPLQCKYFIRGGLDTHVAWFSSGGTSSVIHNDAYENINCLYRGRKTLVFLNTTKYSDQVQSILDKVDGGYSSADVDKIDVVNRPEFRDLEFQHVEMETGDCLYIPMFWVHQVRSFENNLAVNIWWPQREEYPLGTCMDSYSTKITFNKVYFRNLETAFKRDVYTARRVIKAILTADDRTQASLLKLLSAGNEAVMKSQEFAAAVSALFKSLDFDLDGTLSDEELSVKLKRKQYLQVYKAIKDFNTIVFGLHEAAGLEDAAAADRLPKLLLTSNSDESVFAPRRTWAIPGHVEGDNEGLEQQLTEAGNVSEISGDEAGKKDEL